MNMQALMAQAKRMQGELTKATKEIEETEFTYENDNILIKGTGKNTISSINVKNKELLSDVEILEDVLVVGINDILSQISNTKEKKLGKYTGGMGGLF